MLLLEVAVLDKVLFLAVGHNLDVVDTDDLALWEVSEVEDESVSPVNVRCKDIGNLCPLSCDSEVTRHMIDLLTVGCATDLEP